ncbi:MAG TPA: hypothetical protein VEX38_10985, partial [Fimbriimonadaceae bacterium]|nr:hypothetical protein [Fimbriimonadaceae bacterium]
NNPMSAGRKGSIEQFSPDQRKVIRETAELKLKQIAEIGPQKLDELIKKRSQYRHRMGPNLLTDPKWEADVQIPLSFDGKTLEIKNSTDRKVNVSARLPKIDLTEYELSFEGFGDSVVLLGVPVRYKGKPDTRTSNLGPEWLRITRTFCVDKEGYPAVVFEVAPGTVRLRNIQFRRVNTDL